MLFRRQAQAVLTQGRVCAEPAVAQRPHNRVLLRRREYLAFYLLATGRAGAQPPPPQGRPADAQALSHHALCLARFDQADGFLAEGNRIMFTASPARGRLVLGHSA